jgi:caffeoyl-CoA O-methyltransferase
MKNYSLGADEEIAAYVGRTFEPEDAVLREVRERSGREGLPDIHLSAMDARHLEVLARASKARRAVEIGTLGGYSGIALLRGMGPDGRLDTFEIDPHHAEVARESFRKAGVERQATLHVGPAVERLREIQGSVDLVFIDADKESYAAYLDWTEEHLAVGGVVIGDNTFAFGEIVRGQDAGPRALRAFNERLARGGRFRATLFPTGEGMTVGVKVR